MMDGKRVKVESKCDTRCNVGVDRISQLSDDIIVDILSYLTLRDAVSTTVLSTRWYDLWRYIPILDVTQYGKYIRNTKRFTKLMHWIVENHKAHSLKKFSLSLDLGRPSLSAIPKLLEFAFSKRVEVIHLGGYPHNHIYSTNLVDLDELLKLRPSNLLLPSTLKSLRLQRFNVSGEAVGLILRDCHLLERLVIDYAIFTSDIDIYGGLKLKHLEIRCWGGFKSIKVAAPNLTYLGIDGREEIFIENVPNLVELDLVYGKPSKLQNYYFISQLQILTMVIFDHPPLNFMEKRVPTMPKLVELNITYFGRSKSLLHTLTSLVRGSPLQTFKLQVWGQDNEFEKDMEVTNVEAFEHRNLRVFRFYGFDIDVVLHMELVSFILDSCVALRKLIIKVCKIKQNRLPLRISLETDMENAKQLIQPKLPTHVQLQVIKPI